MKHVFAFLFILGIVASVNEYYVLSIFAELVALAGILSILLPRLKKSIKIVDLYFGMPTVWQNVQETLELGIKFGFLTKITRVSCVREFYEWMQDNDDLFEIKVDEQLVKALDPEYGEELQLQDVPVMVRALYYFCYILTKNPERFPEILNAVQVRKRVRGKKQDPEQEVSEELRPMYA